ncbi:MAG: hypothetical protein HY372_01720 [Candidatus Andersenbacteria bacterium]|nr:hypothetical protein [Candidatus Andersenbacteria bacterium]
MKKLRPLDIDKYRGQWVALDPDTNEVLAHASSLDEAETQGVERAGKQPMMYRVPETDAFFVGGTV